MFFKYSLGFVVAFPGQGLHKPSWEYRQGREWSEATQYGAIRRKYRRILRAISPDKNGPATAPFGSWLTTGLGNFSDVIWTK